MYAIVEIMGHRVRAGMVSDVQMGGATLLRIERPTAVDHSGDEPLTEFYAPAAIFAIRPCSQDDAAKAAEAYWPARPQPRELSAAFDGFVDDEPLDLDDEEFVE
jgi:hypothetical protein